MRKNSLATSETCECKSGFSGLEQKLYFEAISKMVLYGVIVWGTVWGTDNVYYNTLHKSNLNFNQNLLVLSFYLRIILIMRAVKNGNWMNLHRCLVLFYNFAAI